MTHLINLKSLNKKLLIDFEANLKAYILIDSHNHPLLDLKMKHKTVNVCISDLNKYWFAALLGEIVIQIKQTLVL